MQANTCLAVLNELTGMFGFFVQYVLLAGQCAELTDQLPDGWGQGCKCGQTPAAICSSSAACSANATLQSPSCRAAALTCGCASDANATFTVVLIVSVIVLHSALCPWPHASSRGGVAYVFRSIPG